MKLCNGMSLMVREALQEKTAGGILLPTTKYTTSKIAICLKTSKKKFKTGAVVDSYIKPGDRVFAVQYDRGHEVSAWKNLMFNIPKDSHVSQDRLPDGCTFTPCLDGEDHAHLEVKKGTPLQVWLRVNDNIDYLAVLDSDEVIDD